VYVLLVIDVAKALRANSLQGAIFVLGTSTEPWIGGAGQPTTNVKNGGKIVWTVTPLDPSQTVSITGFSGRAVPEMMNPSPSSTTNREWSTLVTQAGTAVPYSIALSLGTGEVPFSFDCLVTSTGNVVNVLVAVDLGHALTSGAGVGATQYAFMQDTTGYSGSGQNGQELLTTCYKGDTIVWTMKSIDPGLGISILSFSGAAIGPTTMINPAPYPQYDGTVSGGVVNATGTKVAYTIGLLLEGSVQQSLDAFLTAESPNDADAK
jgi:hypothetical protein